MLQLGRGIGRLHAGPLLIVTDVDRAIDNLAKSGKLFNQPGRRESMPMMGGPESFSNFPSTLAVPCFELSS